MEKAGAALSKAWKPAGGIALKYIERAREVIDIEAEGLHRVSAGLGEAFSQAIDLLLACLQRGNKIIVTGIGKNLPVGQKIAATLTSTGSPAVFLHATDALHGELGIISDGDVVLALSYSGESDELRTLMPAIKRRSVAVVSLTGSLDNFLASCSDVVIPVTVDREACPFNMAPTTTTTATLAVGDALAMVLIEARGFRKEDYAKLHPGGAIGRTLVMKVADIMRTGDRLARIPRGSKVQDAVLAMTEARSGSVVIVEPDGRVAGIFTDGDLRRHLNTSDLPNRVIDTVMSTRPITLQQDQLAVEVLAVFQKHNVDDLIIVDSNGHLAGMVDIQDLPKFKIL
ncbi:MAG TPA: KpsF/GutQ family sugar-phosphate isomerase [Kiritimatiellia bacterium]|nr:KpsF/GutQ family sugar-phosphate isomerase [Kiritimatiellia bacterium]HMP35565.1 KpsF/GutQ family sugar-phosphate isomerase [Kiritimatiellia bacterium]